MADGEHISCTHVQAGEKPLLVVAIGGVPLALCVACIQSYDRQIHLALISHNADPSQGHGGDPPAGMIGRTRTETPPVAYVDRHDVP